MTEKPTCKDCKHFMQHYIRFNRRFTEVMCGHCVYPRIKTRAPRTSACEHFKEKKKG